ncbi:MAG: RNA polymerase sigma factor [Planctomycetota bacterium]|nr:RNA polymerase sigma factor [Planctomycetota bacterium]MDA1211896.1 RNA polymerase sigma factor [Planctomycetota bacterium]
MNQDDAEVIGLCLQGDVDAMHQLVERYQSAVFGLCLRILGHREDAEDTVQDVFLRTFRNLEKWDPMRPFKPWILTIAANRCRTALEKRSRQARTIDNSMDTFNSKHSNRTSDRTDLGEELDLALARLRSDYRICFVLFYQQELSCADISQMLDCPVGTVKIWLHRARKELAEHFTRRGIVPEGHYELPRI